MGRTQDVAPAGPEPACSPGTSWPAWPAGRILIRQAGSGDLGELRAFLSGLSVRTRYLRFFAGAPPAGPAMLRILAGQRPDADALVATRNGTTEIGVVVADAWQGRGVGSGLVSALASRARARGATTLVMEVMAENRQVLAMIAGRWPDARHDRSAAYVTVHARLG